MRVARCRSCGAPYNVGARHDAGAFACARCGATIDADAAPFPRRRGSAALAVVGAAALLSLLLFANPSTGWRSARWPWDAAAEAGAPLRADLALWAATAFVTLLAGLGALGRAGPKIALALVALLAVRAYAPSAAFAVTRMSFAWMAAHVALGAGLLARAGRATGPEARPLLASGALVTLGIYAVSFVDAQGRVPFLAHEVARLREAFAGHARPGELASTHAPFLGQALAVALALLLAVLPRRGGAGRLAAGIGFVALTLAWVLPAASAAERAWEEVSRSARRATELGAAAWFEEGLGLFLLASVVVARLASGAAGRPPEPAP